MPVLSARDNVALPLLLTKLDKHERRRRAETALRVVGLAERSDHLPRTLSGGEQQRVAIARAIVTDPDLIVADEPTGDLDARNAEEILGLLRQLKERVRQDGRDGHARSARAALRRRRLPPRQGHPARGRSGAARRRGDPAGGRRTLDRPARRLTAVKYFGLIRANLGRNKLRTALTGGAIMLAVALVCMLLTMPAGIDAMLASMTSNTRISVHNKAGLVYSMPYAFTRKVRQVDGVAAAMSMTWFGGAFEEAGRVTFPNFAVEPEHVGAVYPDYNIDPQQLADFQRYRDGAIVGRQTMKKYGWKIGDRITLRTTVWPVNLDLRIVGEIPNDRTRNSLVQPRVPRPGAEGARAAGPRHRRHDLGARRRPEPGQRDHAHHRRPVAQQRGGDRQRDREELLLELLRLAAGLRHRSC